MVETNEGLVRVTELDPKKHKIHGNHFVCVVKSKNLEEEMIRFDKHALGDQKPYTRTLLSKEHKVLHEGKLVRACELVNGTTIYPVKYEGENLYNILFEDYGLLKLNGLTVESLHPKNPKAKKYLDVYHFYKKEALKKKLNKMIETKEKKRMNIQTPSF